MIISKVRGFLKASPRHYLHLPPRDWIIFNDLVSTGAEISAVRHIDGHANVKTTARGYRREEKAKRKVGELLNLSIGPDSSKKEWGSQECNVGHLSLLSRLSLRRQYAEMRRSRDQITNRLIGSHPSAPSDSCLDGIGQRAAHPYAAIPHPFLRWAGAKRFALKSIFNVLPPHFKIYREPFLGSGALFFLLCPARAVLSDICSELIETFVAVRDNSAAIRRFLAPMKPRRELFDYVRRNRSASRFKRAAEFIFLNKACWNGLYRVNADGDFNVPFGRPKTDFIVDFDNLRACAKALASPHISLRVCDFEENVLEARRGDLVYLDPPYITGHTGNGFADYNEDLFSWDDQARMASIARYLAAKGVHVIISNANHRKVLRLYPGFGIKTVWRSSTLAGDIPKRRRVSEVLLFSK